MKKNIQNNRNRWLVITIPAIGLVVFLWVCTAVEARGYNTKIHTEVHTPEYVTDTGRAINAYERMMERCMDTTGRDITSLNTNVAQLAVRLDRIEDKIDKLLDSNARIEKALGIDVPAEVLPKQKQLKINKQMSK